MKKIKNKCASCGQRFLNTPHTYKQRGNYCVRCSNKCSKIVSARGFLNTVTKANDQLKEKGIGRERKAMLLQRVRDAKSKFETICWVLKEEYDVETKDIFESQKYYDEAMEMLEGIEKTKKIRKPMTREEYQHARYLKNKQNPEWVKKRRKIARGWQQKHKK